MNLKKNINRIKDVGQSTDIWKSWWRKLNPIKEIQKWDYYGLRPWILKYVPRNDKVLEAGCGLGRWAFYLSNLGIDIDGLDFSKSTIEYLQDWQKKNNMEIKFSEGDVCSLPYENESLSGYISLGVVEHFIDGPQKPLSEAYRVLRPGGIAIITTPGKSWYVLYKKFIKKIKNLIKFFLGKEILSPPFFQYEYSPYELRKYVENAGLCVTRSSGADLMYTFNELGGFKGDNIKEGSLAYYLATNFEKTIFKRWGAQSVTISVKLASKMYCFLCNDKNSTPSSLEQYDVPLCEKCQEHDKNSKYYKKSKDVNYHNKYIMEPDIMVNTDCECKICHKNYFSHNIFEKFGFSEDFCVDCLKEKSNNIYISNNFLQPIWRDRNKI
jgi:ubiquinone/menaquinone biosynthesis C-methylase UbiE